MTPRKVIKARKSECKRTGGHKWCMDAIDRYLHLLNKFFHDLYIHVCNSKVPLSLIILCFPAKYRLYMKLNIYYVACSWYNHWTYFYFLHQMDSIVIGLCDVLLDLSERVQSVGAWGRGLVWPGCDLVGWGLWLFLGWGGVGQGL